MVGNVIQPFQCVDSAGGVRNIELPRRALAIGAFLGLDRPPRARNLLIHALPS